MISELKSLKADQKFISIEGLEKKFGILVEDICAAIKDEGLPTYTHASNYSRNSAAKFCNTRSHRYAKITNICWSGNDVEECTAYLMSEAEEIIKPHFITYYYDRQHKDIFIKPMELRILAKNPGREKRNSTMDVKKQPIYELFRKAYKTVLDKNKSKRPTMYRVLIELKNMTITDNAYFVKPGAKGYITFEEADNNVIEIHYTTLKHWHGDLNQENGFTEPK